MNSAQDPILDLVARSAGRAEVLLHYDAHSGYQLVLCNLAASALFQIPEHHLEKPPIPWSQLPDPLATYLSDALGSASEEGTQSMPDLVFKGSNERRYSVQLLYSVKSGRDIVFPEHWYLFCFENATPWASGLQIEVENRKLQTVGELASGIAHDFNNLIMGIQANAEALLSQQVQQNGEHDFLVNIIRACTSGSSLTQSLLGYVKRQPLNMGEFDVVPMVNDVCNIARITLGAKYPLHLSEELTVGQSSILAYGCYSSLSHCLLNLIKNAREAMPHGGAIEIHWQESNEQNCLSVKDHGAGIPEKDLPRIFEPFFSTKKRGTGLGLAMVQGIMNQHKGMVHVASEINTGTSVSLIWPAYKAPLKDPSKNVRDSLANIKDTQRVSLHQGSQLAFIIDDSDLVREGMTSLLEHLGYRVQAFDEAPKALEALSVRSIPHLILIDFHVPNMDGAEFIRHWFEELPEIYHGAGTQIILVSGNPVYQFQNLLDQYAEHNLGFLQKPFSLDTLNQKIIQMKSIQPIPNQLNGGPHSL